MSQSAINGFTVSLHKEHKEKDGYLYCSDCGDRVMLVTTSGYFEVDREAFKNGEDTPEGTPDEVFVGEVSGHWCPTCQILVSLSYNFD